MRRLFSGHLRLGWGDWVKRVSSPVSSLVLGGVSEMLMTPRHHARRHWASAKRVPMILCSFRRFERQIFRRIRNSFGNILFWIEAMFEEKLKVFENFSFNVTSTFRSCTSTLSWCTVLFSWVWNIHNQHFVMYRVHCTVCSTKFPEFNYLRNIENTSVRTTVLCTIQRKKLVILHKSWQKNN